MGERLFRFARVKFVQAYAILAKLAEYTICIGFTSIDDQSIPFMIVPDRFLNLWDEVVKNIKQGCTLLSFL
jgi:hypothetical protein